MVSIWATIMNSLALLWKWNLICNTNRVRNETIITGETLQSIWGCPHIMSANFGGFSEPLLPHYRLGVEQDLAVLQEFLIPGVLWGYPHMSVHFVKSIGAYNVKSSSTLFSDNIQWSFEIPFPCARFKSLVGYNLITKSSNHQKWDVQAPISWNWKKHALMWDILLWKTLTSVPFEFETYQDG